MRSMNWEPQVLTHACAATRQWREARLSRTQAARPRSRRRGSYHRQRILSPPLPHCALKGVIAQPRVEVPNDNSGALGRALCVNDAGPSRGARAEFGPKPGGEVEVKDPNDPPSRQPPQAVEALHSLGTDGRNTAGEPALTGDARQRAGTVRPGSNSTTPHPLARASERQGMAHQARAPAPPAGPTPQPARRPNAAAER